MEINTLEYSQMKTTSVYVRLWIFLRVIKIHNKLSGAIAGEPQLC